MPDLLLANGTYIEIKGYITAQALAKFEFFYRPLWVLTRAGLQEIFEYVRCRHGKTWSHSTSKMKWDAPEGWQSGRLRQS